VKGLGKNTRYKKTAPLSKSYRKGGSTEVGKESQSYKEYVKTMFGGGATKYKDGGSVPMKAAKRPKPMEAADKMVKPTKEDIASFKKMGASQAEIDRMKKEGVLTVTTVGTRKKRPLDNKRSRGRKYNPANAQTKWTD